MPATPKDIRMHQQPAVAVDLVLLTVIDGALQVVLAQRDDARAAGGAWALPGGIVRMDESPEQTAARVLREKVGGLTAYFEQLRTFGDVERDPRGRVITIAYVALTPPEGVQAALRKERGLRLARLTLMTPDGMPAAVHAHDAKGERMGLAFDHAEIIGAAVQRLRGKLDYTAVGFELLPPQFTLRALQDIHEAILGKPLNKPAFRRKMLDRKILRATGRREKGAAFRPAELFERL